MNYQTFFSYSGFTQTSNSSYSKDEYTDMEKNEASIQTVSSILHSIVYIYSIVILYVWP